MNLLIALLPTAFAGEFIDIWVTTAFEDTNIFVGLSCTVPQQTLCNEVTIFRENYERRVTDDIHAETLFCTTIQKVFTKAGQQRVLLSFDIHLLNPDLT